MKKVLITIVLAMSAFLSTAPQSAYAATYDVIGVGDSIGRQIFPGIGIGIPRWLNGEASRAPTVSGIPPSKTCSVTCVDSTLNASTIQALTWSVVSSEAGGYVIVQEGGYADKNGVALTLNAWKSFVEQVVQLIPNDRTLVFIYPAYDPAIGGGVYEDVMYDRTIAASNIFIAHPEQPRITINWWYAVHTHPLGSTTPYTNTDGLHPSAAGATWLQQQLNAAIS